MCRYKKILANIGVKERDELDKFKEEEIIDATFISWERKLDNLEEPRHKEQAEVRYTTWPCKPGHTPHRNPQHDFRSSSISDFRSSSISRFLHTLVYLLYFYVIT